MRSVRLGWTTCTAHRGGRLGPFDDEDGTFLVLVNDEGQHPLWPLFAQIPAGWSEVHGPAARHECTSYVEANWTDMRPTSLIAAMERDAK
ncbi:MbtH family protein [Rhodococcus sp. NPDC003318]|uniref:MbtH family protein n=1 Tax=Rhodococcus sp. NPDC003318 TaxID=3364503 RepID=UPI0036777564